MYVTLTFVAQCPGNLPDGGLTIFHSIPVNVDIHEKLIGPKPANTQCPECAHFILTKTEPAFGAFACLSSGLFCVLGLVSKAFQADGISI